jgi:hypothetical protein
MTSGSIRRSTSSGHRPPRSPWPCHCPAPDLSIRSPAVFLTSADPSPERPSRGTVGVSRAAELPCRSLPILRPRRFPDVVNEPVVAGGHASAIEAARPTRRCAVAPQRRRALVERGVQRLSSPARWIVLMSRSTLHGRAGARHRCVERQPLQSDAYLTLSKSV